MNLNPAVPYRFVPIVSPKPLSQSQDLSPYGKPQAAINLTQLAQVGPGHYPQHLLDAFAPSVKPTKGHTFTLNSEAGPQGWFGNKADTINGVLKNASPRFGAQTTLNTSETSQTVKITNPQPFIEVKPEDDQVIYSPVNKSRVSIHKHPDVRRTSRFYVGSAALAHEHGNTRLERAYLNWLWYRQGAVPPMKSLYMDVPHLPDALVGRTLIQISDPHFARGDNPEYWAKVQQAINAENPDVILFTGDIVSYAYDVDKNRALQPTGLEQLGVGWWFLEGLKARHKLAVLGNHDFILTDRAPQTKADYDKDKPLMLPQERHDGALAQTILELSGFQVLRNQSVVIDVASPHKPFGSAPIIISGVDDQTLERHDLEKTFTVNELQGVEERQGLEQQVGVPRILLSHNPNVANILNGEHVGKCSLRELRHQLRHGPQKLPSEQWPQVDFKPHLILSGHTHGGQFKIYNGYGSKTFEHAIMDGEYILHKGGLKPMNGYYLYNNTGLGYSSHGNQPYDTELGKNVWVPSLRLGTQPEVTMITLRKADKGQKSVVVSDLPIATTEDFLPK